MKRHVMAWCVGATLLGATQASYAGFDMDWFDLGTAGQQLDQYWGTTSSGATSGAITLASFTGPAANPNAATNIALRVDTGTTTKATTYGPSTQGSWGGPNNNGSSGSFSTSPQPEFHRDYYFMDIYKGTGTSVTNPLWSVLFNGGANNKDMLKFQGTLTGVQMVVLNGATVLHTSSTFTLQTGWNNVCAVYDNDSSPNVSLYLNTDFDSSTKLPLLSAVDTFAAAAGPLGGSSDSSVRAITVTRFNSTASTGSLYLDNIGTSDTLREDGTGFGSGWATEAASYNPAPEPASLLLLAGILPLLRRRS